MARLQNPYFLQEAGFPEAGIQTFAWGNRACLKANLSAWRKRGFFGSLDLPLHKWLQAFLLTGCGRETIKPYHLSQTINVSFKTAALMIEEIKRSAVACEFAVDDTEAASQSPAHHSSADAS